jgi:[glutamine synthetase] adenylyltransferase / [glutamine synthetase]-adenylyl-L-tyrosine phosphorylase
MIPAMQDGSWQEHLAAEHGTLAGPTLAFMQHHAQTRAGEPGIQARVVADVRSFLSACIDPAHMLALWTQDTTGLDLLLRLGGVSRYGFQVACRHPGDFTMIVREGQHRQVWGNRLLSSALLAEQQAAPDRNQERRVLARFKHRHFLRLILGDVSGALGFTALVRELSDVVDVLVQAACAMAEGQALARFPEIAALPAESRAFAVLAMGKHGARELNYSSDIDLIFLYRGIDDAPGDLHDYHKRLGQELIRILENPSDDGQLFRIDMRLRPEGDRGELVLSVRETIDYYYSVGRPWERQAMIKARAIAGDLALGQHLIDELRPWVYPQEPEWETLDESRSMRRRIEERAQEANVKTGAGGIRDIEFLVQYFQLVYGGRDAELRGRATLPMLRALADRGTIPKADARRLEEDYIWLRVVEHRLQMWEDRQEHDLPAAPAARTALAWRCDITGPDALERFDRRHAQVRAKVREIVARHFLATTQEEDAMLALVVQGEADERLAGTYLAKAGLKDHAKACANLRALAAEPFFVLSRGRTERSLVKILPLVLHLISQGPSPDQALANFTRIVQAVGGRATFYDLLGQHAEILTLFVDLAGWSEFLVTLLHDFQGLPDELIDTLNQRPRGVAVLASEARSLIAGLSNPAEPLSFLVARETAAVALRDLEGLSQKEVGIHLSNVAHAVFGALLPKIIAERAHDWGVPIEGRRPTRFAVLGLGKLGSREQTYASDMDVLFVSDPGGRCPRADHDGDEFWTRVSQTLMRTMHEGRLYEIDPRLRPWGDGGPMVANTEALAVYWRDRRELWERMAMLRIAHLAGDPQLGNEALTLIRTAAFTQPLDGGAANEVRDMRRRLEESVAGRDHVKRGWGGYVDHEFTAQYLTLGLDPAAMPVGCATADMFVRLAELGRMPAEAVPELTASLHTLRFIESRMRLAAGKAISSLPTEKESRTHLAKRCNYPDLAAFDLALHLARETGRRWFDRLVR